MKPKLFQKHMCCFDVELLCSFVWSGHCKWCSNWSGFWDAIPGANVVVKGTNQGTVTDFDGKYSIDVKTFPVVLVFSSLGFSSKEVSVNTASVLNVTLSVSATALDEVVITGLATSVKRSNSANAVASISAQKLVGVAQPQTLDGALAGKFSGAIVSSNSGAPGGGMSVKLRGITSVLEILNLYT